MTGFGEGASRGTVCGVVLAGAVGRTVGLAVVAGGGGTVAVGVGDATAVVGARVGTADGDAVGMVVLASGLSAEHAPMNRTAATTRAAAGERVNGRDTIRLLHLRAHRRNGRRCQSRGQHHQPVPKLVTAAMWTNPKPDPAVLRTGGPPTKPPYPELR